MASSTPQTKTTHVHEADKYFVFNETGNILISSTTDSSQPIADSVRKVFSEVSVFFAGMTRAISTAPNPANNNKPYSIYNYKALKNIIDGSGLFVQVTEEHVKHKSNSFGANFSKELIAGVLGLATGGTEIAFAQSMIQSMGSAASVSISGSSSSTDTHVANIIFVCEYLLGMPTISALVVSMDASKHEQQLKVGPCLSEHSVSTTLDLVKETYLFVPPTFISEFSGQLDSAESNPEYVELVNWLQGLVNRTPKAMDVVEKDKTGKPIIVDSGAALATSSAYIIEGQFLPADPDKVTLAFVGDTTTATGKVAVKAGTLSATEIGFTVSGKQASPLPIGIYLDGKLVISTPATFTIASK
jgi:hypothetical protein